MNYKKYVEAVFKRLDPGFTLDGPRQPYTHDYTDKARTFGHDYAITRIFNGGMRINLYGWGYGLHLGDYMILSNGVETTRYEITFVGYYSDPKDMWKAELEFAPRTYEEKGDSK